MSEIQATRADVLKQREVAAAEAARLDAAHAAALAALDVRRREDAAAAEARVTKMERQQTEEIEALEARRELRAKRLSWAFSASRAMLDKTNAALVAERDDMKARFDARESRADDVADIEGLRAKSISSRVCAEGFGQRRSSSPWSLRIAMRMTRCSDRPGEGPCLARLARRQGTSWGRRWARGGRQSRDRTANKRLDAPNSRTCWWFPGRVAR